MLFNIFIYLSARTIKLKTYVKPGETLNGLYYIYSKSHLKIDLQTKRECKWLVD